MIHRYLLSDTAEPEKRTELNRLLLPARGTLNTFTERVDERGIPIPSWWTEDEGDTDVGAQMLALQLKRGPRR